MAKNVKEGKTDVSMRISRRHTWFRRLLAGLAVCATAVVLLVAALPHVVSSDFFRQRACSFLSDSVGLPVSIGNISWRWNAPFAVDHLLVGVEQKEAATGPNWLRVDSLRMDLSWTGLLSGTAAIDVHIAGVAARTDLSTFMVDDADVSSEQPADLRALTDSLASAMGALDREYILPFPVRGAFEVDDASIHIANGPGKPVWHAEHMNFRLDVSDPITKPMTVALGADVSVKGLAPQFPDHPVPLAITATFSNKAHGAVVPSLIDCNMNVSAPGFSCSVKGAVDSGLVADAKADFATLSPYVLALMGEPSVEVSGRFRTSISLFGDGENVRFETMAVLEEMSIRGKGGASGIGPLNVRNTQQGTLGLQSGIVQVESGSLEVPEVAGLDWSGRVHGLYGDDPVLEASVGPIEINLNGVVPLVRDMAPDIGKQMDSLQLTKAVAQINTAMLSLHLANGHGRADVVGAALNIASLGGETAGQKIAAQDVHLSLAEFSSPLSEGMPVLAEIRAGIRTGAVFMGGLSVTSVDVPILEGRVEDAGSGMTSGLVRMAVQGQCKHVQVPALPKALDSLGLKLNIQEFSLGSRQLSGGSMRVSANNDEIFATQVRKLDLGKFEMQGHVKAVLNPALAQSVGLLPESMVRGGPLQLNFDYSGKLPDAQQIKAATGSGSFADRMRGVFSGVRTMHAEVELQPLDFRLAGIELKGLRLTEPFVLDVAPQGEAITADGGLAIADIHGVPGLEDESLPLTFRLGTTLEDFHSLNLEQHVQLAPLDIRYVSKLHILDFSQLVDSFIADGLSGVLQKGNLEFNSRLAAQPEGALPGTRHVSLSGSILGTVSVRLEGGRSLAVDCRAKADQVQASLNDSLSVESLKGDYSFARTYRIAGSGSEEKADLPAARTFDAQELSRSVLQEERRQESVADDLFARRVLRDLRGREQGNRTLRCQRLYWAGPPVPVTMRSLEMQVHEEGGIPSVEFFQAGVMGGSVQGGVFITSHGSENERYAMSVRTAFTGLDADELLPRDVKRLQGEDTELSGQLAVDLPLSESPTRMLELTRVRLDLTHIGTRTLERLLRSLDPHEANRTIVEQRKFLRMGTPRNVRLRIANGNLSLSGEVVALGMRLDLPRLTRFNLAGLPVHDMMEKRLASIGPVVRILNLLTADVLQTTTRGDVHLARTTEAGK